MRHHLDIDKHRSVPHEGRLLPLDTSILNMLYNISTNNLYTSDVACTNSTSM